MGVENEIPLDTIKLPSVNFDKIVKSLRSLMPDPGSSPGQAFLISLPRTRSGGIQKFSKLLDSRFRGNDEKEKFGHFTISSTLNLEF